MFDLIIKNGTLVTAEWSAKGDLAVKNGKIAAIGGGITNASKTIDAEGKLVMPGLIDPHVHISQTFKDQKSADDFHTGTVSAAYGGNTTIIDFATQWDKSYDLVQTLLNRRNLADGNVVFDYSLHACPTESSEDTITILSKLMEMGVPSFKVYLTYKKQGRMMDDAMLYEILKRIGEIGGLLGVHAENQPIADYYEDYFLKRNLRAAKYFPEYKPNIVEAESINRAVYINKWANGNLFVVHLSTAEGLEIIKKAQQDGIKVFTETCTHYLTLTKDVYGKEDGFNFICSPPLRSQRDIDVLWEGVIDGTIPIISSDHVGYSKQQKALGGGDFSQTPNGIPGMEERLPVIYTEGVKTNRISINRLVALLSTNPAKMWGLYPQKGSLAPGTDADIVVVDTEKEILLTSDILHSPVGWTPYEGKKVSGFAYATISKGKVIMENGKFLGKKGDGIFLERKRLFP